MPAEIGSPEAQLTAISQATTVDGHLQLLRTYVSDGTPDYGYYKRVVYDLGPQLEARPNPDYVKLLNLILTFTNQYGFRQISGGIDRHGYRHWQRSYFDPRHQIALAC